MNEHPIISRVAELESLAIFRDFIEKTCKNRPGIDTQFIYDLKLAAEEACTNIITHGYAGMNPGSIILDCRVEPDRVVLTITDFGHQFEPYEPEKPEISSNIDEVTLGGFGLYLIYQCMNEVDYETNEDGNHLILIKYIRKDALVEQENLSKASR